MPSTEQLQPPEVFYKKAVLKNFAIFKVKHLCWSLFLIKLSTFRPVNLLERDPAQVISCCKVFKKTYFEECF